MTTTQEIAAAVAAMAAERDAAWCAKHGMTAERAAAQSSALEDAARMIWDGFVKEGSFDIEGRKYIADREAQAQESAKADAGRLFVSSPDQAKAKLGPVTRDLVTFVHDSAREPVDAPAPKRAEKTDVSTPGPTIAVKAPTPHPLDEPITKAQPKGPGKAG